MNAASNVAQAAKGTTFTTIGWVVFIGVMLLLAANKKTGVYVVWFLVLILVGMVLINARNFQNVMFQQSKGG